MKIINKFSVNILSVVLLCAASASHAGSLAGDSINISYYFPDIGSSVLNFGTRTISASGPTVFSINEPIQFSVSPDAVNLDIVQVSNFTDVPFNGFVVTDLSNDIVLSLSAATRAILDPSRVHTTANSFSINLAGLSLPSGDSISFNVATVSPVPEPEIAAMLLSGLGLIAFIGRRRKPIGNFSLRL